MGLDLTISALADPTRRAVVERLRLGEATVSELAAPHDMSLPAFTKHVRVLVRSGLLARRKVGRSVLCTLQPEPLDELATWATDMTSYWTAVLDRLEQHTRPDPQEEP